VARSVAASLAIPADTWVPFASRGARRGGGRRQRGSIKTKEGKESQRSSIRAATDSLQQPSRAPLSRAEPSRMGRGAARGVGVESSLCFPLIKAGRQRQRPGQGQRQPAATRPRPSSPQNPSGLHAADIIQVLLAREVCIICDSEYVFSMCARQCCMALLPYSRTSQAANRTLERSDHDSKGTFVIYPVDPGFCRNGSISEARLYRYLTDGRPHF